MEQANKIEVKYYRQQIIASVENNRFVLEPEEEVKDETHLLEKYYCSDLS